MSISRWKVMAGVLGVSLGGLAAIAGQCPKSDGTRTQRADDAPLTAEAPKVPPAGAGTTPTPPPIELPAAPAGATLPALPSFSLPETSNFEKPVGTAKKPDLTPPTLPSVPPPTTPTTPTVIPASGTLPMLPKVQEPTVPSIPGPSIPDTKPTTPPVSTEGRPTAPTTVPTPPSGATIPPPIEFTKPSVQATVPDLVPPSVPPVQNANAPAPMVSSPADVRLTAPVNTNAAPPVTTPSSATKFRILLRVGEGEPSFEVRSGDDLVMKVLCEKVDIKSPEKGQSLSSVTASGKVRFAGFGSEGTCENLSFLAGTGEVSMTGSVKIQVKDKLGRVESELTTDTIKYKLDASALPGQLKP
jgi:hypothetical protein